MSTFIKEAASICKTIMRNGYDAYVINTVLQRRILASSTTPEVEICTDMSLADLEALFPGLAPGDQEVLARLDQSGTTILFYSADTADASHPEACVTRITTNMLRKMPVDERPRFSSACPSSLHQTGEYDGFEDLAAGEIRFQGIADETLKHDYLRAIRALRFSANYHLPIEENSWMAIVRASRRILDYVAVSDIMVEWRRVEAENMWRFVELLFEAMIMHGLVPELAALSRIFQKTGEDGASQSVWLHTLQVMKHYSEELPHDWYGALACLFHDCGKLYTGEYDEAYGGGRTMFYQHHRVGAKVARKILKRLSLNAEDVDVVCHLVRNHMRFRVMLTDKGIRRFKSLDEYPRLIELARANLKARGAAYTEFNHNQKMLDRADISEELLEPLLNGKQIMQIAGIKPGPAVGLIRDNLLQAQIAGDVTNVEDAERFVITYKVKEQLS